MSIHKSAVQSKIEIPQNPQIENWNLEIFASMRVKIVAIESTTRRPSTLTDLEASWLFPERPLKFVPILQCFGLTDDGLKCCVHVHQVIWI